MATSGGPNITKEGLVLSLDAASSKSFKGEPTRNYTKDNLWGGDGTNQSFAVKGWRLISDDALKYNKMDTVLWTPGISLNCYLNGADRLYFDEVSTVWTFSCYIKREDGGILSNSTIGVYIYNMGSNTGNGVIENVGNGWYRVSRTVTGDSNYVSLVGFYNFITGYKYYLSGWQLEKKAYPTAVLLTNTTRGTNVTTGGGWIDRSGSNNHGELVNGITYDNDGSLLFDGVNDRVIVSNNSSLNVDKFTLSFVVYPKSSSIKEMVIRHSNETSGIGPFEVYQSGLSIYVRHNGASIGGISNGLILNKWNYIQLTYNKQYMRLYLNGVKSMEVSRNVATNSSIGPLCIGGYYDGSYSFDGKIASVSLINTDLTEQQILQNFNATKSRFGL